jgi:predicted transcriptional regulator
MTNFANFMITNGLKRKQIAAFLGVSGAFITQISSGDRPLPEEKLAMIKENAYGWDITMLTSNSVDPQIGGVVQEPYDSKYETLMSLMREMRDKNTKDSHVEYLEQKVKDQDTLIQELCKQVGMLKAELDLARKGEIASIVVGSSDVNAV